MSAPGAHPPGDIWPRILDQHRCGEVNENRRCQLYRDHEGGHAHAEGIPTQRLPVRRWTDDGERWTEEPGYGVRWCCMYAALNG